MRGKTAGNLAFEPKQRRYRREVIWRGMLMATIYDTSVRGADRRSESDRRWIIECADHHQISEQATYHDARVNALDRTWWCHAGEEHPEDAYSWERADAKGG